MSYKEEGKWWVSPANFLDEVTKNFDFPEKIEILDTTLQMCIRDRPQSEHRWREQKSHPDPQDPEYLK